MNGDVGDVICFSRLRWGFVFRRSHHLMARFAERQRVFFIEEPLFEADRRSADWKQYASPEGVIVSIPRLPKRCRPEEEIALRRALIDELFSNEWMQPDVFWFYTPMALPWTRHLSARVSVYDCMDVFAPSSSTPPEFRALEDELFERTDLVFTGGRSMHEVTRFRHPAVHDFPSSVDVEHFLEARSGPPEPADQAPIPRPRLGFCGVIDERVDLDLVASLAEARPDLHLVMLGPVARAHPKRLPQRPNLHWLGAKPYQELPAYLGGWDVALMPFALNASTRFMSPSKPLEYLAAGRPVVSTPIHDVVESYGKLDLVHIADRDRFHDAVASALARDPSQHHAAADAYLAGTSWDRTFGAMSSLIDARLASSPLARQPEISERTPPFESNTG